MDKIKVLGKKLQELIAAGEVVERPASVVKELAENSIDAGATAITVEIKNGGLSFIRISDNGCGMSPADARTAFLRHATSKIRTEDDLLSIYTMGFRGEALCAVSGVSKVRLLTKEKNAEFGYSLYLEGSEIIEEGEYGCPDGTTITVSDLFYNTPARLQFMKSASSEGNHVISIMEKLALSRPDVSFKVISDGKEALFTAGDGRLISAVFSVYGKTVSDNVLPADYTKDGITVSGFVCKPLAARANRNMQVFFVNGRYIKNATVTAALERAYKNSIMTARFPYCVLFIDLNASKIDVNVHPTKQEIKFSDENSVFGCVYYGVKSALEAETYAVTTMDGAKTASETGEKLKPGYEMPSEIKTAREEKSSETAAETHTEKYDVKNDMPEGLKLTFCDVAPVATSPAFSVDFYRAPNIEFDSTMRSVRDGKDTGDSRIAAPIAETTARESARESEGDIMDGVAEEADAQKVLFSVPEPQTLTGADTPFVFGQLFSTYVLAQTGDEFIMIDKHAACERIIFNRLKEQSDGFSSQMLLVPLQINLAREDFDLLSANIDKINEYGFSLEEFGDGCLVTREIPTVISGDDAQSLLEEIAGSIRCSGDVADPALHDDILHSVACKAAVKAGSEMTLEEMRSFTEKLLSMPEVRYCPHGRPVMVRLTKSEIEKLFRRKR